ncbi:YqhR family membrane protein [Paenibacillus pinihumi]|uniref:YqhR family membrane protein n=1 Tax=Paenibacillus pinihumi TaxID=669462 RepID=UPI00041D4981|nr:YqhR family membrane protein [Paenibacillus pinihumi]
MVKTGDSPYHGHKTNRWLYGLNTGFFAGLIWGLFHWLLYSINFTRVLPGFLLDSFMQRSFLLSYWGVAAGIGAYIVFSILATYLYMLTLGQYRGPWPGLFYGMFWWAVIFLGIGPFWGMVLPFNKLGWDSITTEFCIFLIWGIFIGYTIAFEFHDEASREPANAG